MVDISEFTIDTTALRDGDEVEILGLSDKIKFDHKRDFYELIVVKSKRTGDTINVLGTDFFKFDFYNRRATFISSHTLVGKVFALSMESTLSLDNAVDIEHIDNLAEKKFKRVFYDTDFITLDVRGYPAVTGNLFYGNMTTTMDAEIQGYINTYVKETTDSVSIPLD
jgi:hypothetical protein